MSKVAQLKKKAAEFELKKQFDKALALYVEILDGYEQNPEEVDVALFNRVGDLMLRLGNVADAIDYYERAVDLYAEGGFFNNAIALCNKILRQTPGRASVYYKLGKISAQKGFKSDAKRNFLEYADRMQKSGRLDEAFRALKEFADLCPDQDDIRLMLAEQLSKQERAGEAIEQLQTLYERYAESGREAEARATLDRMRAIDPAATPRGATGGIRAQQSQDLIFLDLNETSRPTRETLVQPATPIAPPQSLGLIEQSGGEELGLSGAASAEFERIQPDASVSGSFGTIEGLEQTGMGESPIGTPPGGPSMLDLEPTSLGGLPDAPPPPADLEPTLLDAVTSAGLPLDPVVLDAARDTRRPTTPSGIEFLSGTEPEPERETEPETGHPSGMVELPSLIAEDISLEDWRGPRERESQEPHRSPVEGLPLMDLELPVRPSGAQPTARTTGGVPRISELSEFTVPTTGAVPVVPAPTPEDIRAIAAVTPSSVAPHTRAVARSLDDLKVAVDREPANAALRRELGEAMLEAGQREDGLDELEHAMTAFERADDLESAASVADEIVRANPGSVRLQQKRVEYAFRTNDKPRLVEAYLDLASALLHGGQSEKARAVYQRVLDLAPDEPRAVSALAAFTPL
ncbi:MAG TPA: tetratricopeptide repeat protein, partial [Gemmatimonadaceae bacterium]|nr:tetratricopeptide repeat protein [Gemmatimonadaceae bacterium]